MRRQLGKLVFLAIPIAVLLFAVLLPSHTRQAASDKARLRVLCDFLPMYVFTRNVVGNVPGVTVDLLISTNVGCPHDYSLRPADMQKIAQADVLVANGLGLDPFLDGVTRNNPRLRLLTVSDACKTLPSKVEEHEHEAAEHAHEAAGHDHDESVNPHVWVSPAQAARQVTTLAEKLAAIDPQHAKEYQANAAAYASRLTALLGRMQERAKAFRNRNIVTFHEAFAYLAADLNLNVVATLTQDPEHAPSAHEMATLIETIKKEHAAAIFYEPAYSDRVARTISHDTGVPMYALNPFNSMDREPDLQSYETVMEQNMAVLEKALGGAQ